MKLLYRLRHPKAYKQLKEIVKELTKPRKFEFAGQDGFPSVHCYDCWFVDTKVKTYSGCEIYNRFGLKYCGCLCAHHNEVEKPEGAFVQLDELHYEAVKGGHIEKFGFNDETKEWIKTGKIDWGEINGHKPKKSSLSIEDLIRKD